MLISARTGEHVEVVIVSFAKKGTYVSVGVMVVAASTRGTDRPSCNRVSWRARRCVSRCCKSGYRTNWVLDFA